jgi:hypothetical protein
VLQDHARFNYYQELIKRLPIEHRETLRHLLRHLTEVIKLSDQNRMSLKNIALLFGPNILRGESVADGYNPLMVQNQIVEYMLVNFKDLFSFPLDAVFDDHLIS